MRIMPATSYRYLTQIPGVCAGHTIIEGTRIGVHDVVGVLQNGETVDTISGSVRQVAFFRCARAGEEGFDSGLSYRCG